MHATPEQWRAAFDDTGKTWLVHLTGGEPSHYPDFAELCARLAERHYLSLNSNLTGPSLARFAELVDPSRVSFINAGLHPGERARKEGQAIFLRHAELLAARGFPVMVTVVATPDALRGFERIIDSLRPIGLMPIPKLLQGRYGRRRYPEGYTAEERRLFTHYLKRAEPTYPALFDDAAERPSIDPTIGRKFLRGRPDYRGRLCTAGRDYVKIEANGQVERCGDGPPLGNLLERSLRLELGPTPCDRSHCFYVCEKYTARALPKRDAPIAALVERMRQMVGRRAIGA